MLVTAQNPNFVETCGLVDAGLGLGFDAFKLNAMRFEAWHQQAKNHARQGMGKPVENVHAVHEDLTDKAAHGMDVSLQTLGRIPPTPELRRRFDIVPKSVFDARYHRRMLRPGHGSRPVGSIPTHHADVCSSDR